ncbi:IucA/IucC family protein [Ectopseudomonas alcaliphila]|uniref:IucA/IucC family protein n=1 Tax=Ectopseudomonas alcaliphila TaxID=101564 RepID=UPI00278831F2|nr:MULTISPECIES: IucA/IucC family siderophore biosynthesis protein [Pseudomonas]MDP9941649.1 siderophore synthetase component [Pseudomonas sp. 3400]MDR7013868.1 siderophore synthetase component [Pseudomonas alcaliphila]
MTSPRLDHPVAAVAHLTPELWRKVNRLLVRKAIAEYAHEQLFSPQLLGVAEREGWQRYELAADTEGCVYRFEARTMALRHWHIEPASIERLLDGQPQALDALTFVIDFKRTLGIPADKLPVYLDEISSTLYGAAFKHGERALSSAELADADYQTIEAAMIEGHPGFVANNGRLGFNAFDYHAYAPETGSRFAIIWLAVHRDNAHFAAVPGLDHEQLLREELGEAQLQAYRQQLQEQGLNADDYLLMPTHPWQWFSKLSLMFAADIAQRKIVPLGRSSDEYVAQQSLRTYYNMSQPQRCYVKTSLSILNMGFMRGLSPYYMAGTPAINAYLDQLIDSDPVLREYGFSILREVASVGYRNRYYEAALETDSPYKKMLSALWRESPASRLKSGERLMTMAALLHVDPQGQALLPELIRRSGLAPRAWMRRYMDAFLRPLMHCFYAHHLVFMPHGENLILVLDGHVPVRAIMKDIAEESAILDKDAQMPPGLERLAVDVPEDYKILGIFIDVFDGVFRHMSQILEENQCMSETEFWRGVAESVIDYQHAHPELAERFARYDFFAPSFLHSCLNRLQLKNNLQMVDLANPAGSLIMAEPLANPVAPFAPRVEHEPAPRRIAELQR